MVPRDDIVFPVGEVPTDPGVARLVGLYPQRQEGLFMQRVRVPSGRVTREQWRALASIAARYTPHYPIHVTTRQDVELHGVLPGDVGLVQRELDKVGLTGLSACGDALRNITACPHAGLLPGTVDTDPIAEALQAAADEMPWIRSMPRKFKISLCGCDNLCAKPWINDLGLVARADATFQAIVAGSLGARPGTGLLLYDAMPPEEVVPLLVATLKLFNEHGDRENRRRARLRHIRERWGDQEFARRLKEAHQREIADGRWSTVPVQVAEGPPLHVTRLQLPHGDMPASVALKLASLVEEPADALRVGLAHDLYLFTETPPELPASLERMVGGPAVVSCPGTTWCSRGIADSRAAEDRIRSELPADSALTVGISGCPNNCAHAAVADIGLVGARGREGAEAYRLTAGGGGGRTAKLGLELHPRVPADLVGKAGALIEDTYRNRQRDGQSLEQFVAGNPAELRSAIEEMLGEA